MPLRHVGNTEAEYYLVLFDADGNERREADESLLSQRLGEDIQDGVTDVFFASHGWKGDIPAAIRQYDSWVGTMAAQDRDRALARERYPGFKAMAVCVHWPSLPWGVEDAGAALLDDVDEFAAEQELSNGELVDMYAARIANTDAARSALAVILAGADDPETARQVAKSQLTPDLEAAYQTLFDEAGLSLGGPAAAPGLDHQNFTPATTISTWLPAAQNQPAPAFSPEPQPGLLSDGFRGAVRDALLMPVRQLSFWAMKHRARQVGETGVHTLLAGGAAGRARHPLPPHGAQFRLHRGLRRDSRADHARGYHLAPAPSGQFAVPRPGRPVSVVVRGASSVPAEPSWLLPADRPGAGASQRADRRYALALRPRGRNVLPARRHGGERAIAGRRGGPAAIRRRRHLRYPRRGRP